MLFVFLGLNCLIKLEQRGMERRLGLMPFVYRQRGPFAALAMIGAPEPRAERFH